MYPRIPAPRPPLTEETADHYGAVLFAHVLTHGPATLDLAQCELAAYAGQRASAVRGLSEPVYARYSMTRHVLAQTIAQLTAPAVVTCAPGCAATAEPAGPMALLLPVPIVRPPSGSYADAPDVDDRYRGRMAPVADRIAF